MWECLDGRLSFTRLGRPSACTTARVSTVRLKFHCKVVGRLSPFWCRRGGDALFAARIRLNGRSCRSACGGLAADEFQGRRDFAGWNKSPGTPGNGELLTLKKPAHPPEIGRASCRERGQLSGGEG